MRTRSAAISAVLGASGLCAVLSATPAQAAASCDFTQAVTNDSTYAGYFTSNYSTYTLRTGPSTSCSKTDIAVDAGTKVYGWCAVQNISSGAWWAYIRIAGTQEKGWASEVNLTYDGEGQWGLCP